MSNPSNPEGLSTPDIPASSVVFSAKATTRINASAALVFRTLRNTETWKDWNRWVPRVTITYQPPDEDIATKAEVEDLVRRTSIAVSIDSDLEGLNGDVPGFEGRPKSPRPLTPRGAYRQRLLSDASRTSKSSTGSKTKTETSDTAPTNNQSTTNGTSTLSAAQKFQQSQANRKASISAGEEPEPAFNLLVQAPTNPNLLLPAPNTASSQAATQKRRSSLLSPSQKRQLSINALYGEPSVRIQLNTKLTFHVRMRLPTTQSTRELAIKVTEVSRPDDDDQETLLPPTSNNNTTTTSDRRHLSRVQTHTPNATGVYRIVWGSTGAYSPPKSYPSFLLQAQRVHEIRPLKGIVDGTGRPIDACEYTSWECQRGVLAKVVKKQYGDYIQKQFVVWNEGLRDFCESLTGGAVERRDFSVS